MTFIGRNPGQVDYVISSSNFVQNAIISRRHARVVRSVESSSFRIHDDSRNGVFVNNVKISGEMTLTKRGLTVQKSCNKDWLLANFKSNNMKSLL